MAVVCGYSPLVAVLPTGGGKSLLFMLPAILPRANTTVLVVPFRALIRDVLERCERANISCREWDSRSHSHATLRPALVVVSTERAVSDGFLEYVSYLKTQRILDRIVVDECHLCLTSASYRRSMLSLDRLRAIGCPFLLLTATLPPSMEGPLSRRLLLPRLIVIRAPTHRANIVYSVRVIADAGAATARIREEMVQLARAEQAALRPGEKAVVYCRTKAMCEYMARELGCGTYHSTAEEKSQVLRAWLYGMDNLVVATGALGAGIDFQSIRAVLHYGCPYGLIDFAQESGRAGRDGGISRSTVVVGERELAELVRQQQQQQSEPSCGSLDNMDTRAMTMYLTANRCRRLTLGEYLDGGEAQECISLAAARCDVCRLEEEEEEEQQQQHHHHHQQQQQHHQQHQHQQQQQQQQQQWRWPAEQAHPSTSALVAGSSSSTSSGHIEQVSLGARLRKERIKQDAEWVKSMELALERLVGSCPVCWLLCSPEAAKGHGFGQCTHVERSAYSSFKRSVQYAPYTCCFYCGVPQSICPRPRRTDVSCCKYPNIVLPMAWAVSLADNQLREGIELAMSRELPRGARYAAWLGEKTKHDDKMTNAFLVFERVMRWLGLL